MQYDQVWDVIIVGAGMGGSAAAHRLASRGHKVLLLEKGASEFDRGNIESVGDPDADEAKRLTWGKWPTQFRMEVDGKTSQIWPAVGCGVGGSTLLYASALSRLEPADFETQKTPSGETVEWPYSYDELEPYYLQAEELLRVRGTVDPRDKTSTYDLYPPPAMGDGDRELFQDLRQKGLSPYRIHVGIEYKDGCGECGGYVCPLKCKMDAGSAFIDTVERNSKLTVLANCNVERIHADERSVKYLQVQVEGSSTQLKARQYILAAGGYFSPILLMRSRNEYWPRGVGNKHDIVGRYLMFHTHEHIAVWNHSGTAEDQPSRTIALRDFYRLDGECHGEVQSTGLTAGYGNVLHFLNLQFDQSPLSALKPLRPLLRIVAYVASKLFKEATVLATIVQDYPYYENRVEYDIHAPSELKVVYRVSEELANRTYRVRKELIKRVGLMRAFPLWTGINLNYGHVCGTCRAGDSASNSVIDKSCRVHEIDNLYIADSSFMPISGGANPSLTIAANALKVADCIDASLADS